MANDNDPTKNPGQEPMSAADKVNLGFGILAILCLGGALASGYLPGPNRPNEQIVRGLQYTGYGFMALYVLSLAWLKRQDLVKGASHKHAKSGANATVQIVAVLAILTAVNWLGTRYHHRIDLTENKQYSLADQTVKILKNLKDPVKVTVFVKTGDPQSENLKKLWEQYRFHGDGKLNVEVVDVDQNPVRAREAKLTDYGTSVLKRGDRDTTITGKAEQDLTSALVKVTQNSQKIVYFTAGHGEFALDKTDREGISFVKDALEKQNYKVDTLVLLDKKAIPSDASALVLAGPTKAFSDAERLALKTYLDNGGRVFLATQPQTDPKLGALTEAYGIRLNNDLVLDPASNAGDLAAPVVQKFPFHTVTQGLQVAYFQGARSLSKLEKLPAGVNISPLAESSKDAWGETSFADQQIKLDPGDFKGPVPLILLAEKGKGRLVVSGNTSFIANPNFLRYNNGDLFMNTVNWMADEESLVAIPPKDSAPKPIDLLPNQQIGVFLGVVVGLPLLLLVFAGMIWWRRR